MAKSSADIRAHVRATLRYVKGPPPPDNAAEVNALLDMFCGGTINVSNVQRVIIQKRRPVRHGCHPPLPRVLRRV